MKVYELIERLQDYDENADVYIMSQSGWPFEQGIHGVTTREEICDNDEPFTEDELDSQTKFSDSPFMDRWSVNDSKLPQTDIFIVEGPQLRYGSARAWDSH